MSMECRDVTARSVDVDEVLPLTDVLCEHAEEAASLHAIRSALTAAPHVRLKHIRRFDDRILAHLDGLLIGGANSWPLLDAEFATPSVGALFASGVVAIESRSVERLNLLYAAAEAMPEFRRGLVYAFGWTEQRFLRGVVRELLVSSKAFLRYLGVAACAWHRVDPGSVREATLEAPDVLLRDRALRAAGELGRRELAPSCIAMLESDEESSRFWAAWSAVILGNRDSALQVLMEIGEKIGPFRDRAFRLSVQVLDATDSRAWLRTMAGNPDNSGYLFQGAGIAGDPAYVPWLIGHMSDKKRSRIAGEAFSLITGLDLAYLDLERKPPRDIGEGPTDAPEDPSVGLDQDDGLPWPDPDRVSKWWHANGGRFEAGTRYFLGEPVSRNKCLTALKEGFQRQRILAAYHLSLLEPGTTLFEWRAPAARQQRLLAAMT
jgi:uncharacterized protein (TIGR02270 family)